MRAILAAYGILPDPEPDESTGHLLYRDLNKLQKQILVSPPRRMGYTTKYACIGAVACLNKRDNIPIPGERLGVFHGSALGNIRETYQVQKDIFTLTDNLPSPIKFSASLNNMSSFFVAVLVGAKGPNIIVSQDELSFEGALLSAMLASDGGDIDYALVGGTDCSFGTRQELSTSLRFSEETVFGEGTGWMLLGPDSDSSLGEVVEVKVLNNLGTMDGSNKSKQLQQYVIDRINFNRQNYEDIYLIPGLRIDPPLIGGIADSFSKTQVIHYLDKTGTYPTAVANGLADVISHAHDPGLYVHLVISGLGQISVLIIRLKGFDG